MDREHIVLSVRTDDGIAEVGSLVQ